MLQSHTPQIPPSPARVAAAHSPSLSQNPTNPNLNPTPKLPPSSSATAVSGVGTGGHPSTSAAAPATTISSALLPLLPPLPRAQALIPQMASLVTKLYDVSPHRSSWLASYRGSFPNFLSPSAAAPAAAATTSPSTSKDIVALFGSLQAQLFDAVAELQEILDLQDSRAKLAREVKAKDATLLAFAKKIREAQQVLDDLVDDFAEYRRDRKRPRTDGGERMEGSVYRAALRSGLDLDEILTYAHRISYTTFAPPEHGAGLAPLRGALPPAPQDNEMRASQLYHVADLDVGMPKKAALEAKDRAAANAVSDILMESTPPREEPPPAVAIPPPMLPILVPAGWRKGMPVELPSELPPVPPGWKPGDPITLPLDGVTVGNREEPQRPAGIPGPAPVPPKAPEAIQVKYVQLDINPDQDEYSSDYSSSGSSEEEEED